MTLLACMGGGSELGIANRRKIAALGRSLLLMPTIVAQPVKDVELALGRPIVKKMLFMCAMVAIKNNCNLKAFYETLYKQRQT
ncbi:MAG: hypothetical protein LBT18_04200 [Endomicrobium sp.]|jgi:hypothetical protein|nr:hypothetical protein [Endomicrobium sp.]